MNRHASYFFLSFWDIYMLVYFAFSGIVIVLMLWINFLEFQEDMEFGIRHEFQLHMYAAKW